MDEAVIQKVASEDGNFISKEDFIKVCQDQKLLDFGGPMGEKRKHTTVTPRKEREIEPDANVRSPLSSKDVRRQDHIPYSVLYNPTLSSNIVFTPVPCTLMRIITPTHFKILVRRVGLALLLWEQGGAGG